MDNEVPHGALVSLEETQALILRAKEAPITIYRVPKTGTKIQKREINAQSKVEVISERVLLEYHIPDAKFSFSKRGRVVISNHSSSNFDIDKHYIFLNYWHAWAHVQKQMQIA